MVLIVSHSRYRGKLFRCKKIVKNPLWDRSHNELFGNAGKNIVPVLSRRQNLWLFLDLVLDNTRTAGAKARNFHKGIQRTAEEAAEKVIFIALRFAARMPAAARKCYFPTTYGTAKAVPFRKISRKLSFSAASESRALPR